jgi:hypothetical protein
VTSKDLFRAWSCMVAVRRPSLSIEVTRECPLRCPACYAYQDNHFGEGISLRQLADKKGDALVQEVLEVVNLYRPLHLSIVGGAPPIVSESWLLCCPNRTRAGCMSSSSPVPSVKSRNRGCGFGVSVSLSRSMDSSPNMMPVENPPLTLGSSKTSEDMHSRFTRLFAYQ